MKTPKKTFDFKKWYLIGTTVNYKKGKYWAYAFENGNKIYGTAYTRTNPKLDYETNWGFDKDSLYI